MTLTDKSKSCKTAKFMTLDRQTKSQTDRQKNQTDSKTDKKIYRPTDSQTLNDKSRQKV